MVARSTISNRVLLALGILILIGVSVIGQPVWPAIVIGIVFGTAGFLIDHIPSASPTSYFGKGQISAWTSCIGGVAVALWVKPMSVAGLELWPVAILEYFSTVYICWGLLILVWPKISKAATQ